ncbi:type II toxin-antitoxin system VapC family toxin [Endothiovibrio diazotrophicus]
MSGTLVDTCVLRDVVQGDANWLDWSLSQLESAAERAPLFYNDMVYSELSIGFATIEEVEATIRGFGLEHLAMPREALFLAGKVFLDYRRDKGQKRAPLPDFFIAAHAAVTGLPLLTRDTRRVRGHFPTVTLISPH